jgi:hypothetical protein
MDYFADGYYGQDDSSQGVMFPPAFVYDDRRSCSKLYVFLKLLGFVFYSSTLSTCDKPDFYFLIIILMGLSTLNNIRYEYAHYKRYGTVFLSIVEFELWKKAQWPKSKVVFSGIELGIKIFFIINTFPPQFEFHNLCNYGESVFKIHLMALLIIYIFLSIFSCCIISTFWVHDYQYPHPRQPPALAAAANHVSISFIPLITVNNNQNEECCICLETDIIQPWSMLPCGHKFHGSCVSTWLQTHQTCPVCRLDITATANSVV